MADAAVMAPGLAGWTIYNSPRDYPGLFVARRWVARKGLVEATDEIIIGMTLEQVRVQLPAGLVMLDRHPNDEPHIVEVWI